MGEKRFCVGIAREIKPGEYRVAGLPEHVRRLRELGCAVVVESGAGSGAAAQDEDYVAAGAEIAPDAAALYGRADLIWKVKEILPQEFGLIRAENIIFTYLHAVPRPEMTETLRSRGCIAIAYEEIMDDAGRRPLLAPMSRLAGAGAIALAAQFCQSLYGGNGKLLFSTEGSEPARVTILGGGTAGRAAAHAALGAGARVNILEPVVALRKRLEELFPSANVMDSGSDAISALLPETDVLLNCTFWMPGDPHFVTREMLGLMPPRSLIMDVSADANGGIETSVETTHDDPVRVVDGVLHYCVQNIPSLFASTASGILADTTFPYLENIVRKGVDGSVRDDADLRRGVVVWRGLLVGDDLARCQGVETLRPDELIPHLRG